MGTPPFAAHILSALLKASYRPVAVYTQPPRPCGRGYKVTPSPVHELAASQNLPIFTPASLKSEAVQNEWKSLELDIAIVVAYGLILPKSFLEGPRLGCVNVHASLLPRWRGAAPIQWAILSGDSKTGVTLMKMDEGLDTGPILSTEEISLDHATTTPYLFEKLADLGAEALVKTLPRYAEGTLSPVPQPTEGVTYAEKIKKEEGHVDWTLCAEVLDRQIRALNPWPGTWCKVGEDRLKILEAIPLMGEAFSSCPGTVLDDHFTVACGAGALRVTKVQKQGRAPLSAEEFLKGYSLPPRLPHAPL